MSSTWDIRPVVAFDAEEVSFCLLHHLGPDRTESISYENAKILGLIRVLQEPGRLPDGALIGNYRLELRTNKIEIKVRRIVK